MVWINTLPTVTPVSRGGQPKKTYLTGKEMRAFTDWEVPQQGDQLPPKLLRYSHKNAKVCRAAPVLTENSLNVCNSRVEPVCMVEGGRLERGCGAGGNKTKLHWSEPHIVSDKDAAKRAVRAPVKSSELPDDTREEAANRWSFVGTLHRCAHGLQRAPPRCCCRPAPC